MNLKAFKRRSLAEAMQKHYATEHCLKNPKNGRGKCLNCYWLMGKCNKGFGVKLGQEAKLRAIAEAGVEIRKIYTVTEDETSPEVPAEPPMDVLNSPAPEAPAPEAPAPEGPEATEAPEAPEKAPEAPETAPEAPEGPKAPEAPEMAPEAPEAPAKAPEVPVGVGPGNDAPALVKPVRIISPFKFFRWG